MANAYRIAKRNPVFTRMMPLTKIEAARYEPKAKQMIKHSLIRIGR
jgi:hypothetical protein